MTSADPKRAELRSLVSQFLWDEWDPIGVNQFAQARDEYENYVPRICELLGLGNAEAEVGRYLALVEHAMGLEPDPSRVESVAKRLISAASKALQT